MKKNITIDSSIHATVTADKSAAFEGETVTLTVTNAEGYAVTDIRVNGGKVAVTDNKDGTYSFTMPAGDVTVTVEEIATRWESGDCLVTYAIDGTLTVCKKPGDGNGAMADYSDIYAAPWKNERSSVKTVVVDEGVTSIGKFAFCDYGRLTSLTIPESVTSIGSDAFWRCNSLTSLTIPDGVTSIGGSAFKDCTSLKSINLPESGLKSTTFSNCTDLTDFFFFGTKDEWDSGYSIIKLPATCKVHYEFTRVPAAEPTYGKDGNIEYYTDSENNVYISVGGGFTESSLEAVTIPALTTTVVINSIDINGMITPTTVIAETFTADDYTVPASPYLDGYDFAGWRVNDTLYTMADEVMSAVAALVAEKPETAVTVKVVYEKRPEVYTVTVNGGTLRNGKNGGSYQASVQLYVTADTAPEGKKFDHWEKDGVTVGYDKTYAFRMPSADTTLTAVYSDTSVEVEAVGTAYIESIKKTAANKLSFVSVVSVPNGATILKAGVVANTSVALDGTELTTANAKYTRFNDTTCKNFTTFKYTWTKGSVTADDEWCVRSYLVYSDSKGEYTVYGDTVTATLSSAE